MYTNTYLAMGTQIYQPIYLYIGGGYFFLFRKSLMISIPNPSGLTR